MTTTIDNRFKKERTNEKKTRKYNNRHMFVYLLPIGCLFLVSFSLSFGIMLLSTTKPIIAQSVVILTIRHSKPHIAYHFMLLLYFKDTQHITHTHAGTDSIHLFLKYNIMTISSSPLRSIFCFVYLFVIFFCCCCWSFFSSFFQVSSLSL